MKSTYEKPSEKKKRIQTENLKRIKRLQKLKKRYLEKNSNSDDITSYEIFMDKKKYENYVNKLD